MHSRNKVESCPFGRVLVSRPRDTGYRFQIPCGYTKSAAFRILRNSCAFLFLHGKPYTVCII